jgi:putative ABC transport system permease protein
MSDFIIITLRNLWKNRKRAAFIITSIVMGSATMVVMEGYFTATYWGMGFGAIHGRGRGHLQIYKKDYSVYGEKEPDKYILNTDEQSLILKELKKFNEIEYISPRLSVNGLLTDGTQSAFFSGEGAEPKMDSFIKIKDYSMYENATGILDDHPYDITIGHGMADAYGFTSGSKITLYGTAFDSSFNALDLTIADVFTTGYKEADLLTIEISLHAAQNLLKTNGVHSMVIALKEDTDSPLQWHGEDLDRMQSRIRNALNTLKIDYEIRNWVELSQDYRAVKQMYDMFSGIIRVLFITLIVLNMANILLLSVIERTREIGTLRALGYRRSVVGLLFTLEGLWMGITGSAFGVILGYSVSKMINIMGFTWAPPGSGTAYPVTIVNRFEDLIFNLLLFIIVSVAASFFASVRAMKLEIAEAMRAK